MKKQLFESFSQRLQTLTFVFLYTLPSLMVGGWGSFTEFSIFSIHFNLFSLNVVDNFFILVEGFQAVLLIRAGF